MEKVGCVRKEKANQFLAVMSSSINYGRTKEAIKHM
jgi:hypothetical protein